MKNTRLPGHGLQAEGKPYVPNTSDDYAATHDPDYPWKRAYNAWDSGVALCECGWTSAELESDGQRKRAHAAHKDEVRSGTSLDRNEDPR